LGRPAIAARARQAWGIAGAGTSVTSPPRSRSLLRDHPVLRRWPFAVFAAQAVALVVLGILHQPWFDEAQAWLLARDSSPWDLFAHHLRHEGSPGLWHLMLMGPAKLGMPYRTISVISGLGALAGTALLLWKSPFPLLVRVLYPFSYFALYQYGVIARSYALVAPLLFWAAIAHRDRLRRPGWFTVALILLANVALHGFIVAIAWEALLLASLRGAWPQLDALERRRQKIWIAAFAANAVVEIAELWPPADLIGGGQWDLSPHHAITMAWGLVTNLPVAPLSILAVAVTLYWLWLRRSLLIYLLPTLGLLVLFDIRYFSPWHSGMLLLVFLAAVWVAREQARPPRRSIPAGLTPAVSAAMVVVLAGLCGWSAAAMARDADEPYSGAPAAAAFIQQHALQGQVAVVGKWAIGLLPYFSGVIFTDYNDGHGPAFYPWSTHEPIPSTGSVLADSPHWLLLSVKSQSRMAVRCPVGYHRVAVFPGALDWAGGTWESEAFVLLERDNQDPLGPGRGDTVCAVI